jgi:predicted MPP superfamily phosphohydrolase
MISPRPDSVWGRLPLEIGASKPLLIREERVQGFGLASPLRILYASDLHLGWAWTRSLVEELELGVERARPDLLLLGGDLADRPGGLAALRTMTRRLAARVPVWAIAGNHDRLLGARSVRAAVEETGGRWLEDSRLELGGARGVIIEGALRAGGTAAGRVLCAHDPAVFPRAAAAGYRLVLAGHLHGGQCVLGSRDGRLYPGAWFNRWTGLRFESSGSTLLVSRGAGDTLPLRWNCPREALLCEIR